MSVEDGIEIHFEERGSGPLVVIGCQWNMYPPALEPFIREMEADHRVVRYDDRGTGESTRTGPFDMDTGAGDLAAVLRELDESAVIVGIGDAPPRAVRVGASEPDLVAAVVCMATAPVGRQNFADTESLASTEAVIQALLQQLEIDYRGAVRTLMSAGNPQLTEEELRSRTETQVERIPAEVGAARLRAWIADDPLEQAQALGDRLWILANDAMTGGWFPIGRALVELVDRLLPEAHLAQVADGLVSRPDETARIVRQITAQKRVPAG